MAGRQAVSHPTSVCNKEHFPHGSCLSVCLSVCTALTDSPLTPVSFQTALHASPRTVRRGKLKISTRQLKREIKKERGISSLSGASPICLKVRRFRLIVLPIKVKVKVHPTTGHEGPKEEQKYSSTISLTSALDEGGGSAPRPCRFTPGKNPVPIVQEAGWAPRGRSGRVRKTSPPTGIRSPYRPARSESLYRLSYPGSVLRYYEYECGPLVE
jgi:hypothetical protein